MNVQGGEGSVVTGTEAWPEAPAVSVLGALGTGSRLAVVCSAPQLWRT